jgi:hypothetical protein
MTQRTKPLQLIKGHLTKEQKEVREQAESELLTGFSIKEEEEVKNSEIAHKEFLRIKKLLKAIKKDDDLYGRMINTHCLLLAECYEFEKIKAGLFIDLKDLGIEYKDGKLEFIDYINQKDKIQSKILSCDKKIMEKRKMMLDIAKSNIMTIESSLRSIPKKAQKKDDSPMTAFLKQRRGNNA